MKIVAFDTETTGLPQYVNGKTYYPGIIEIGIVEYWTDTKVSQKWSQFINPETDSIDPVIWKITGIKPEDVEAAPTFPVVFPEIARRFHGASLCVGFNHIGFDCPIIQASMDRYGLSYHLPWPPEHVDVMLASKDFADIPGKTGRKYPKLTELYKQLFNEEFNAHRAADDAEATLRCYLEMGV